MRRIERREGAFDPVQWQGWHPVIARAIAVRGGSPHEQGSGLEGLAKPEMKGLGTAAEIVVDAILSGRKIVCCADFDSDGAQAAAVIVRGLRMLGALHVDFVVPDRLTMGYGLTEGAVDLAAEKGCEVLITVDCGISNIDGVRYARSKNMVVVVSDHHACPEVLPDADAIVNPQMADCPFASKNLAGVGVAFYLLIAVRARLREMDRLPPGQITDLIPYVAVGTVGDLVRLDANNRILVRNGLARIRSGRVGAGYRALAEATGTGLSNVTTSHLGFNWVPALNSAGRIDNMRIGIECLLSDSDEGARGTAFELCELNRQRRSMQAEMTIDGAFLLEGQEGRHGVVVHDPHFHEGIVGLLASRYKDQLYRPVMVFANSQREGELKGSGRSIPGINIRDAMLLAGQLAPGSLIRGGGHAMACGASAAANHLDAFAAAFDEACRRLAPDRAFEEIVLTDGRLGESSIDLDLARALETSGPWGQGFEEPRFEGSFRVLGVKTMGKDGTHVRYSLDIDGQTIQAVHFGGAENIQKKQLDCIYQVSVNRWNGREELQLRVEEICS